MVSLTTNFAARVVEAVHHFDHSLTQYTKDGDFDPESYDQAILNTEHLKPGEQI